MPALGPRKRRLVASILVPVAVLGAVGVMALPAAAGTLGGQTVTSGDARFQVLSPTLIRTEFAGDGSFTDAATFNAIGRNDFAPKPFKSAVKDGWLTIDTGKMVIRYKEGSGAFSSENLTVALTTGSGQKVAGAPWVASALPECAPGALCETEALSLHGLAAASNHTGYTGTGFVAGYEAVGNTLAFTTKVDDAGDYDLTLRYANNRAGDGQITTRTLSVVVDDQAPQQIQLAPGDSWDAWKLASAKLKLSKGEHHVTVERTSSDSGNVNIDSLAVVPSGAAYPAPSAVVVGCAFGAVCEAETSTLKSGATLATDHNGFSAGGFVAGLAQRASLTTHVTGVPAAGAYALQVRYASGQPTARTISVQPNGAAATAASLAATSGWDYWRTVAVPVQLTAGDNDVTIGCPDADSCNLNVDTVAFAGANAPFLAPHAALGGYRRDLDTANGTVKTNPGLLFQDGWSLVDDTASSLYDVKTKKVTPRGNHGGKDYLDGYVFGYGSEYTTGLDDLTRLTGPSALLPRWAYGVWYSEYYDRTQAQFTDSVVPRFSTEGVPVDVVAIDTDYKAPDKWNGWEVDPSRFPDMAGFLSWLHSQGIHNTLNIHPSISADDPKLAAAQATAGGTLTKSGDNYLFDWSDPLQLKAYFDLHNDTQQAGADIWWLDWCCSENSKYSENGVTPDAYINSQYAQYSNDALDGRGFAFSRAYGSLTAGGYGNPQPVPTGPWADKRTTLHFTGDTVSTWQMLQAEVGYTPGESASTGLAAISHDIGGHTGGTTFPGAEPGSTQLAGDLYARWVQLGTFQPIDRLHSNHSDRLPWQYGETADASATKFLNLRENLVPLTYTLAAQANATGIPIVRPLYLQYPDAQEAYAMAGREYLYGPDVLVAPVTSPGETATTTVWFPDGSDWTDYFTGRTYKGGTTADVTTDLNSMPVFVRAGGIVPTRTHNVANDSQHPLDAVTLTVAGGASGSFELYEDSGKNQPSDKGAAGASATTAISYTRGDTGGTLDIARVKGSYPGKVTHRAWATTIANVDRPTVVSVDGKAVGPTAWSYNADARTLTVQLAARPVSKQTSISFSTAAVGPGGKPFTG